MSVELKIINPTISELCAIVGGQLELIGDADATSPVSALTTSSADAAAGAVFCAIKGSRVDGADFITDAVSKGAVCVITSRIPDEAREGGMSFAAILVDNVIGAIGTFAGWYRDHSKAKFIAITGSVGKTTTKEMVAAVASSVYKTHKTQGNYNNELGLPLTLLELAPDDEVSVLELGMSDLGEIEYMSRLAKPDIAIVTNIGTSHLATLGTRENICRAKLEICTGLTEGGIVLLNADEPLLFEKADELPYDVRLMSIYNRKGDYRALNIRTTADGLTFDMIYDNKAVTNIDIPIHGKHNVYNALSAYAVGTVLGMTDDQIRRGLLAFVGAEMRQRIYDIGGITLIDDCYNASPESMRAAIDVLVSIAARNDKRPLALLGDMLELGDYSRLMHDQLGQYAAQAKVSKLFCYGMMSDVVAEAAIKKGIRAENVFVCLDTRDPQTMANMILDIAQEGDILLVKASRAIHAERVIECLKKKLQKIRHQRQQK
ncbi:MAG: UDP-N-acetylmuramoyl-tripeptide--D-alanyl-D-alanine ligase [Clostridia bacterium]|nr:UDP-N-acetylmuramoyl-tripeptide--D-alanyl-D-alanine ligase [Clostridia bacterium]